MALIEKAYLDIHNGKPAPLILNIEGEDYPEDLSFYFKGVEDFHPLERLFIDRCRGKVLDAGDGPGRMALELQSRGLKAVCMDNSPVMKKIAEESGFMGTYMTGSLLDEKGIPGSYDTVVLLGNTTGICRSVSDLELLIANLAGALNQGGSMMITFTDPAEFDRDDDTLLEFEALYKNEREKGSWFLAGPDSVETVISRYGVLEFADLREGLYGFSARKA